MNARHHDFFTELAHAERAARTLLSDGLGPSNVNNHLASLMVAADVRPALLQAGGHRAVEGAAGFALKAFYAGVALGLRLRNLERLSDGGDGA
jgi:hypothetical protein